MKTPDFAALLNVAEAPEYIGRVRRELPQVLDPRTAGIKQAVHLLLRAPSKMLRPRLLFAASGSNMASPGLVTAGVSIELLHLGTLVHDDIIDGAQTRRGAPSINAREGDHQALLVGDYLLATACQQASRIGSEAAMLVSSAIATLCEGESRELKDLHNIKRSSEAYFEAIRAKTAVLFATACQLGSLLAALPPAQVAALGRYGEHFGLMFQLLDDVCDFLSTSEHMGKQVGQDVREGNYTLPVILALGSEREGAVHGLLTEPEIRVEALIEMLLSQKTFHQTLDAAVRQADLAAKEVRDYNLSPNLAAFPKAYLHHVLQASIAPRFRPNFRGRF